MEKRDTLRRRKPTRIHCATRYFFFTNCDTTAKRHSELKLHLKVGLCCAVPLLEPEFSLFLSQNFELQSLKTLGGLALVTFPLKEVKCETLHLSTKESSFNFLKKENT